MAKPSKLRSFDPKKQRLDVKKFSNSSLSNIVTPLIFRKNLISDACIYDRTRSVITQDL